MGNPRLKGPAEAACVPPAGDLLRDQRDGRLARPRRPLGAGLRTAPKAPWRRRCSFSAPGFLPALLTPFFVARLERPPPRFVLPAIYAAEAAAFLGLALLADSFSLAAVVAVAAIDGALALTAKTLTRAVTATMLEPEGELRAGNAILNVAFTGGRRDRPGRGRRRRRRPRRPVGAAARRRLLLRDRLDRLHGQAPARRRSPSRGACAIRSAPERAYIRDHTTLNRLIGAQAVVLVFFTIVIPVEVIYAKETLGVSDAGYGLLLGQLGDRDGARQRRLRHPAPRPAAAAALLQHDRRSGPATSAWRRRRPWPSPAPPARSGGAGNGVQWVTVVSAVQELTVRPDAGAGDQRARIDELGDAGDRLRARRADRDGLRHPRAPSPSPASGVDRHRARGGPAAGHELARTNGQRGPVRGGRRRRYGGVDSRNAMRDCPWRDRPASPTWR